MNEALLAPAADALSPLLDKVVFLGGATIGLWLTDPAARAPRVTYDVDVVVEVTSLSGYETFQAQLRALRFREDIDSGVICRWKHADRAIILDAVPVEQRLAGFTGRWLRRAASHADTVTLASQQIIRAIVPPWLIVTKLEAFADRGNDDCLTSRDFEDLVTLVDGREQLTNEIAALPPDAGTYIREQLTRISALRDYHYGVEGALAGDRARAQAVTLPRLDALTRQ